MSIIHFASDQYVYMSDQKPQLDYDALCLFFSKMFSIHLRFANQKIQQWTLNQEELSKDQGILKLYFRPFLRWFDRNLESLFVDGGKQVRTTKLYV